ncbi:DUF3987 domain-containing protein [Streptomyces stramineus]
MGHVTPEEFRENMSRTARQGGSYNRLLFLPVEQIRWLSERHQRPPHLIPDAGEAMAQAIRFAQRTKLVTLSEGAYDAADIIRRDLVTKARETPNLKAFSARCNEQARRVAALFALFDLRSEITAEDLEAAAALVRYAMDFVDEITTDLDAPRAIKEPRSLYEKVRDRIELHGGKATSSQVLPFVGATASEVKALPGVVVRSEKWVTVAARPWYSPWLTLSPRPIRHRPQHQRPYLGQR